MADSVHARNRMDSDSSSDSSSSSSSSESQPSDLETVQVDKSRKRKKATKKKKTKRRRGQSKVIRKQAKQVSDLKDLYYYPQNMYYENENYEGGNPVYGDNFVMTQEQPVSDRLSEPVSDPAPSQSFDFDLATQLKEPAVTATPSNQLELLNSIQYFSNDNWNNVRYVESQKIYNARPGYVDLEVNDEIKSLEKVSHLPSADRFLGAVTRGLVMQSEAMQQGFRQIVDWAKETGNLDPDQLTLKLKEVFSVDYQKISRDCIQLICGRRADIVEQRREVFIKQLRDQSFKSCLKKIPPSSEFLFDKVPFSEFVKNNGGVNKIFYMNKLNISGQEKKTTRPQAAYPGPSGYRSSSRPSALTMNYRFPPPQSVEAFYNYQSINPFNNNSKFFRPQPRGQQAGQRFYQPSRFQRNEPQNNIPRGRGSGKFNRKL